MKYNGPVRTKKGMAEMLQSRPGVRSPAAAFLYYAFSNGKVTFRQYTGDRKAAVQGTGGKFLRADGKDGFHIVDTAFGCFFGKEIACVGISGLSGGINEIEIAVVVVGEGIFYGGLDMEAVIDIRYAG